MIQIKIITQLWQGQYIWQIDEKTEVFSSRVGEDRRFSKVSPFLGTSEDVGPRNRPKALPLLESVGEMSPESLRQKEGSNPAKAGESSHDDQREYSVNCSLKWESWTQDRNISCHCYWWHSIALHSKCSARRSAQPCWLWAFNHCGGGNGHNMVTLAPFPEPLNSIF